MPSPSQPHRKAESFAGKIRLESMTLRCRRDELRRIKDAYARECGERPKLSLSRFLAECVVTGLPGSLSAVPLSDLSPENVATIVAEMIGTRLSNVESAIAAIADVLQQLTTRVAAIDESAQRIHDDTATVREIIERIVEREAEDGDADPEGSEESRP